MGFRGSPDGGRGRCLHPVRMASVTITLELRQAGDELDGRASDGDGEGHAFSGWLGLLVAIDGLLQNAQADALPQTAAD